MPTHLLHHDKFRSQATHVAVGCLQDRETVLRCREAKTNDQLDGITLSVVRFLETTQRLRIHTITVEYVINSANVVRMCTRLHAITHTPLSLARVCVL